MTGIVCVMLAVLVPSRVAVVSALLMLLLLGDILLQGLCGLGLRSSSVSCRVYVCVAAMQLLLHSE